jgi:hypothetical protein
VGGDDQGIRQAASKKGRKTGDAQWKRLNGIAAAC